MTRIPSRIVQTAKDSNLTLKQRAIATNLRLLNPDYEYLFFDDDDVEAFIDREFPEYRKTFDSFRYPIQRYDFFRYLAIYRLGGFYFDLDVLLAESLTPLEHHGCVFPFEGLTYSSLLRKNGMDWEIGNYAFGCSACHPFLDAVIRNCVKAQSEPQWVAPLMRGAPLFSKDEYYVLNSTGPGLVSRTLLENPELASTVTVLFPDDVCDQNYWNVFGHYGVHLMEGGWRPSKSLVFRRFSQAWEVLMMQRLLSRSKRLGKTRRVVGGTTDATCRVV